MGKIEPMKQENHSNDEKENNVSNISSVEGNVSNIQKHSSSKHKKQKRISHSSAASMSPPMKRVCVSKEMSEKIVAYNIGLMKNYKPGEEEAEKRIGVSTKLSLFHYPWNITKILTASDLGHLSRLLLQTCLVEEYIMPFLDAASREQVRTLRGLRVNVWDFDTNSMHSLVFKYWESSHSYVFIGHWGSDFLRRRDLAAGDKIGMCWDSFYSRFNFSVLNRLPRTEASASASASAAAADHDMTNSS